MKKITPATLTLVMFGIIGLLVMGYVAKNLLAVQEKKVVPAMRDVPMALSDIPPGTIVTENHIGLGKMQVDQLTREMLLTNRVIVGRVARLPLKAAEPIKANQLYQPGELPPLEVAAGMRAVSIQVGDGASMVDGMIKPGDHVDVLFTSEGGGASDTTFQGGVTMRLFEGVKILAINRNFTQARLDRGANHVTLELTEPQTNVIVLARDRGKLTLTYNPNGRGTGGLTLSNSERVTLYEILGLTKAEAAKDPLLTEIYRGRSRTTQYFDDKGRFLGDRGSAAQGNAPPQYVLPKNSPTDPSAIPQDNDPSGVPLPSTGRPTQTPQETPRPSPTASLPLPMRN